MLFTSNVCHVGCCILGLWYIIGSASVGVVAVCKALCVIVIAFVCATTAIAITTSAVMGRLNLCDCQRNQGPAYTGGAAHTHPSVHTHTDAHTHTHTLTYTRTYMHTYTQTCIHTLPDAYIHYTHRYVRKCLHVYKYVYTCIVRSSACLCRGPS